MSAPRIRTALIGFLLFAAATSVGAAAGAPGGATMTREERVAFLQNARIISSHDIGKGITRPVRVTLTDGTTTHDAGFSTVDEHVAVMRFQSGRTELDFVDSYKYSVAAYNLAVLLGLDDMMPATVEREISHHKGSLVWWVDDVKYDEGRPAEAEAVGAGSGCVEPPDVPHARSSRSWSPTRTGTPGTCSSRATGSSG